MKPSGIPQKPYEDQLCDYCPVRKPGYISPRDKEEQQRQAFVSDLISALQHATDARAGRDDKARARDAYTQLQYDFPDVAVDDLAALHREVTRALETDTALRYVPTTAIISNIAAGAKAQGRDADVTLQYQHLAAVYCVQYVRHLLTMDVALASRHLDRCVSAFPVHITFDQHPATHSMTAVHALTDVPEPTTLVNSDPPLTPTGILAHAAGLAPTPDPRPPTPPPPHTDAAHQDDDDAPYEALDHPAHALTTHPLPIVAPVRPAPQGPWHARLVALGTVADAECLCLEAVWGGDALLQCDALSPLIHSLAALAAAQVVRSPGAMARVPTMWAALGAPPPTLPAKGLCSRRLQALTAFTAHAAALVDDSQCKAALAAHLHSGFVPLLAAALACLAATPTTQHPDLQMMASTCEVLAFYLLHTPSKATTGSKLLSSGALRALSQLFAKHALQHDAEALRRCTLFAAAATPESRDWLAQVPHLPDVVLGEVFAQHELVEGHGLAWAALLGQSSVRGGLGQTVWSLLEGDGARQPLALARASRVLSLATEVVRASGPRVSVWTAEEVQALAELAQHVRRAYEDDAEGDAVEKQHHLQGVCLRLLRELTAVQRQGSKKAID